MLGVYPARQTNVWSVELLRPQSADAKKVAVAGEVDFDFEGCAVIGEGCRKIWGGLELQIHHRVAADFLQHDAPQVHFGDHLRGIESVVSRVAGDIGPAGGAAVG